MTKDQLLKILEDFSREACIDIHVVGTDFRYSVLEVDADVDGNAVLYVGDLDA